MNKIPYKVRLWLSVGLFAWAIVSFTASIIFYENTKHLWAIIVVPIVAFICFILSIVFFPRFKEDGTPTAEPKQNAKKLPQYKSKRIKRPFISEKEWIELDEEDEECTYIDDSQ